MPSVHKVLGFLLNPNPHTLCFFSQLGLLGNSQMESVAGLIRGSLRHCGMEGVCRRHSPTDREPHSRGLSSEACRDRFGNLLGLPLHPSLAPFPLPVSPAHLLFLGTSPRRCPGRWGPRAGQSTPRLPRPGSGSISRASCAPWGWTPAAVRVAGTAGPDWRPWLSASCSLGDQGRCTAREEQNQALP